jgi:nicotinamidase-related amidase
MRFPKDTALVLIDVQQGFEDPRWGRRNNPEAEANVAKLLAAWRDAGLPVIHVQHLSTSPGSPLRPGQPGCDFKAEARPAEGETIVQKHVNSAFIGTDLERFLRERGIGSVVVAGLTTNHCVSTTARMSGNLGFSTFVVADATATFDRTDHEGRHFAAEDVHAISLASLHGEFATVLTTSQALQALGTGSEAAA